MSHEFLQYPAGMFRNPIYDNGRCWHVVNSHYCGQSADAECHESQIARSNRVSKEEQKIVDAVIEAQRLADCVVDAAVNWHKSDMEESMDAAEALENAVDKLLEFRRTMRIVKQR